MGDTGGLLKVIVVNRKDEFITKYIYGNNIVDLDEYVVRLTSYCPLECTYCFINEFNRDKTARIYNNYDKLDNEIRKIRTKTGSIPLYFNAGENADSLLFDAKYRITSKIVPIFQKYRNVYLELRTKTVNTGNLLRLKNKNNIIAAFSLSPETAIRKYESKSAGLDERISALLECQKSGFKTGIRFEPVINIPDLEKEYTGIIQKLADSLDKQAIHSITVSCIRFTRNQYSKLMNESNEIVFDEFVLCPDNKYRYYRLLRVKMYNTIIRLIREYLPGIPVLLATEPGYIWKSCKLNLLTMPKICNI